MTDPTARVEAEATEVLGQRSCSSGPSPDSPTSSTFWGFLILGLTIIECVGALFGRDFAIPFIGTWPILGFLEDLFGLLVMFGIIVFAIIRRTQQPGEPRSLVAVLRLPHLRAPG